MASPEYHEPADLKSRLKASYDAMAPEYNTWTTQKGEAASLRMHYVGQLITLLTPSTSTSTSAPADAKLSLLELGAGAGVPATARLLSALPSAHITANDISSTQVSLGRANLLSFGVDRVTWAEGDMTTHPTLLALPPASLDAVLALYSVIHLPLAEQEAMLSRIWGWLKPGGYLLANFSEEAARGIVMEKWLHEKGWMFWSGFGAEETLGKLKGLGFEVVVGEVKEDEVDASFLWVIARKPATA